MGEKLGSPNRELRYADWGFANVIIVEIAHCRAAKDGHQKFDIAWSCRFVE